MKIINIINKEWKQLEIEFIEDDKFARELQLEEIKKDVEVKRKVKRHAFRSYIANKYPQLDLFSSN